MNRKVHKRDRINNVMLCIIARILNNVHIQALKTLQYKKKTQQFYYILCTSLKNSLNWTVELNTRNTERKKKHTNCFIISEMLTGHTSKRNDTKKNSTAPKNTKNRLRTHYIILNMPLFPVSSNDWYTKQQQKLKMFYLTNNGKEYSL